LGNGKECPERDTLDFDEGHLKCQGAIDFGSRARSTLKSACGSIDADAPACQWQTSRVNLAPRTRASGDNSVNFNDR